MDNKMKEIEEYVRHLKALCPTTWEEIKKLESQKEELEKESFKQRVENQNIGRQYEQTEAKIKELEKLKVTDHPLFKAANRTALNQAETIRRLISERDEAEAKIKELEAIRSDERQFRAKAILEIAELNRKNKELTEGIEEYFNDENKIMQYYRGRKLKKLVEKK